MDFYPQDLLVGVFPLVFAVNAIAPESSSTASSSSSSSSQQDNNSKRTLFDRFLDVVAASLVDVEVDNNSNTNNSSTSVDKKRSVSLFRADDEDESSDEDDFELGFAQTKRRASSSTLSSGFYYAGFGRRHPQNPYNNTGTSNSTAGTSAMDTSSSNKNPNAVGDSNPATAAGASYAKALTHGQGFFQRARIEAVSTKHGFPPSKDPSGTENLALLLSNTSTNTSSSRDKLQKFLQQHPVANGIITAGWLEKHVHALPSVILVVCTVTSNQKAQALQDKRLLETIAHFCISLVAKRHCKIHVVGLLQDDVSLTQGDIWSRAISNHIWQEHEQQQETSFSASTSDPPFCVSLLRASTDLQSDIVGTGQPASLAFRRLHQSVRDASMVYYLGQARRTKEKLSKILQQGKRQTGGQQQQQQNQRNHTNNKQQDGGPPPQLLPLVIRYCFKIAMFYEFQWKFEKSLRFMVEAYRHTMKYYEYILSLRRELSSSSSSTKPRGGKAGAEAGMDHSHSVSDTGDSFEVSLVNESSMDDTAQWWDTVIPPPPDDMIHQCRAVAEWLNLKLLQAGFASHTEGGLLAAANQWRQHCRLFCTRRHAAIRTKKDNGDSHEWFEWSYIARQRLVMSQLVERHPPKALGDLGNDYDDVLLRCSPWRTYESATEATLRIAREIDKVQQQEQQQPASIHGKKKDPMRARYVGGLDSEGLQPELCELCKVDHRAKALEIVLRAISLYERESEKEKRGFYAEDNFSERSSSRAGARLYYLAGGILLGMERHQEAVVHLEKASKFSRGWRALEVSIRRMLIECYEKHLPTSSQVSEESNQAIASMILDSYFNADMLPRDLRLALGHFASTSGGESLKWYHETVDEEDMSLPFSFAISFPGRTHAAAGDTVEASVLITSNLDYAVHVNSVVLLSLAGQLPIPSSDLLCAANASEGGSDGGIIIQSKTSIIVSTQLDLPRDISIIASDDSGNGGEIQGVAGKGSFAKSARPRTAGVTSAGGARLVAEGEVSHGNRVSQGWSLRYLGGKPLRCDGVQLVFYPVQVERELGSAETVTLIELTIEKKKPKTLANIKRTPFEEENYIASAWSRPLILPLSRGPRSLRVLGPTPELLIKDMTEEVTGGKVVEGTINRILLKFTAGPQERCNNIKYRVSCFSVLITPNGSTKRLVSEEEISMSEGFMDMKNPSCRTPTLVAPSDDPSRNGATEYGYNLPEGWSLAESGQSFTGPTLPLLAGGESKFVELNFYRPASLIHQSAADDDANIGDVSLCKTDFYVTASYRQERAVVQKTRRSTIRRSGLRRRPVIGSASKSDSVEEPVDGMPNFEEQDEKIDDSSEEPSFEEVSLEFTGSVVWGKALKASFQSGARIACPSGGRSKSNRVSPETGSSEADEVISLIEGESVTTRCSFQADTTVEGLKTEIIGVRFEDSDVGEQSPVFLSLRSSNESNLLYSPGPTDPCRVLSVGSKLSVAYTVIPSLRRTPDGAGAKSTLGTIIVDWKPSSLPLPIDAQLDEDALGGIHSHGPLRLQTPSTIRFSGPACSIESAPFEAAVESVLATPRMGVPFGVNYRITNKTNLHQVVSVHLIVDPFSQALDGLVFSGMASGELSLAPTETQIISYTILATRAGRARLPSLEVSSHRYQSWIIKEASNKDIYIFP